MLNKKNYYPDKKICMKVNGIHHLEFNIKNIKQMTTKN